MRIVIGGPYNSGILATGAVEGAYYNYAPAPPEILDRVAAIEAVCGRHGVRLPAAALQFPLAHPAVACVIPGGRTRAETEANARPARGGDPGRVLVRAQGAGPRRPGGAAALLTQPHE